jgi:Na+-transporting NADH:ubiquinone oxidoreductase subunit NqrB
MPLRLRTHLQNLRLPADPRYFQIAVLSALWLYGLRSFDFGMPFGQSVLTLTAALGFQCLFSKIYKLPVFDPRSPLISGLSLCLLLRAGSPWLAVAAAGITIGSKFLVRTKTGHIFNPTNFGIVVLLLLSDQVWVSPGQWGSGTLLAFLFACTGVLVLNRAARSDITFAFLGFYAAMIFGRALYLGDPIAIPIRQLQGGSLLLFAFFMISDPKTTPRSRAGRLVFAFIVAALGVGLTYNWYHPLRNGIFYALALGSLTLPILNTWKPGPIYKWRTTPKEKQNEKQEIIGTRVPAA